MFVLTYIIAKNLSLPVDTYSQDCTSELTLIYPNVLGTRGGPQQLPILIGDALSMRVVSDYYTIRMAVYQIIIRYAVEHCVCRGRRLTRSVHVKGHNWKTCARIVAALQGMNHLDMPNSYFSSSSEKVCFLIPLSLLYI